MDKGNLRLSIITVNLNNAEELERTILSVEIQTWQDFELLVIDGGSTDGSLQIMDKYRERINHRVSEPDRGIYHAMNKGIEKAQGEYLLFLNSGDYLFDEQSLLSGFSEPFTEDLILFDYQRRTDSGLQNETYFDRTFSFLINGSICHQSVLHKRTVFDKVGNYNEELSIAADYEFFLKAIYRLNCSTRFINKLLTVYNDIAGKSKNESVLLKEREIALKTIFDNRLIDILIDQNKMIESLLKYKDQYEGLMKSNSVLVALRLSRLLKKIPGRKG